MRSGSSVAGFLRVVLYYSCLRYWRLDAATPARSEENYQKVAESAGGPAGRHSVYDLTISPHCRYGGVLQ